MEAVESTSVVAIQWIKLILELTGRAGSTLAAIGLAEPTAG